MLIVNPMRFFVAAGVLATSPVHALEKTLQIKASAIATVRAAPRLTTNETYQDTRMTNGNFKLSLSKTLSNTSGSGPIPSASALSSVFINSGYNKTTANVRTDSYLTNNLSFPSQQATSNGLVESLAIDRITFTNLVPGANYQLFYKDSFFYVRNTSLSTTFQAPDVLTNNNFFYSTRVQIFDNLADSQSLTNAKYDTSFTRCNNIFVCGQANIYNSAPYNNDNKKFFVGVDDVMFITNSLSIWTESTLSIAQGNQALGSATFSSKIFPQFVGERTLQFLNGTPVVSSLFGGKGFAADSGSDYVATVPEPASWAMLIAGFGLTGAAMRRRRHGPTSVAA